MAIEPVTELDEQYSDPEATATPWREGQRQLQDAEVYWLSTVRRDGRPHVTPVIGVWLGDALHFCTGPEEQKAENLERNRKCVLTTGCNAMSHGFDVVLEGEAAPVADPTALVRLAEAFESKYGPEWHFDVEEAGFSHDAGTALVFAVRPRKVWGYTRGDKGGATRWRFSAATA